MRQLISWLQLVSTKLFRLGLQVNVYIFENPMLQNEALMKYIGCLHEINIGSNFKMMVAYNTKRHSLQAKVDYI